MTSEEKRRSSYQNGHGKSARLLLTWCGGKTQHFGVRFDLQQLSHQGGDQRRGLVATNHVFFCAAASITSARFGGVRFNSGRSDECAPQACGEYRAKNCVFLLLFAPASEGGVLADVVFIVWGIKTLEKRLKPTETGLLPQSRQYFCVSSPRVLFDVLHEGFYGYCY